MATGTSWPGGTIPKMVMVCALMLGTDGANGARVRAHRVVTPEREVADGAHHAHCISARDGVEALGGGPRCPRRSIGEEQHGEHGGGEELYRVPGHLRLLVCGLRNSPWR